MRDRERERERERDVERICVESSSSAVSALKCAYTTSGCPIKSLISFDFSIVFDIFTFLIFSFHPQRKVPTTDI
jgi:hypothetical protein